MNTISTAMPTVTDQHCPRCRAMAGQPCTSSSGRASRVPHVARDQHRRELLDHGCPFVVVLDSDCRGLVADREYRATARTLTADEIKIIEITDQGFITLGHQPRENATFVRWDFE